MDANTASEIAKRALVKISQSMADDAEFLATEIEVRGIPVTGPEALRLYAAGVRAAAAKTEAA